MPATRGCAILWDYACQDAGGVWGSAEEVPGTIQAPVMRRDGPFSPHRGRGSGGGIVPGIGL